MFVETARLSGGAVSADVAAGAATPTLVGGAGSGVTSALFSATPATTAPAVPRSRVPPKYTAHTLVSDSLDVLMCGRDDGAVVLWRRDERTKEMKVR